MKTGLLTDSGQFCIMLSYVWTEEPCQLLPAPGSVIVCAAAQLPKWDSGIGYYQIE